VQNQRANDEGVKYTKGTETAGELEAMILKDLSKLDGCHQSGITVIVYGMFWKSIPMFAAAAGPVCNN
jgi:hypothetical protein